MIHTLDKYQQEALSKIKVSNLVLLQGNKYTGKSYLIRYYLKELWSHGQKSIIVVPDIDYANMYLKHLGAFGLSDFAFILDENFIGSKKFEIQINHLLNNDYITINKKEILLKKLIYTKSLDKILNYYNVLNNKLLNDKTLNELFLINSFDKRAFENIYFNQIIDPDKFDFDKQEYNALKQNIKKAFELQLEGKNKTIKYFSPKNYRLNDPLKAWENIKNWIHDSRIQTIKSIQYISGFMQEQSSLQFDKIWQKTKSVLRNIENLIFEIDKFNILFEDFDKDKINLFGLDKKIKQQKEEYQLATQKIIIEYKKIIDQFNTIQLIQQNYNLPAREEVNINLIYKNLNKILSEREKLKNIILSSIKRELKSMNFRNIKNNAIIPLEEQLKKLFSILNSGFVIDKWEDNAFSINKQLDFLENLLHDLKNLEEMKITFINNFEWNKFIFSLDFKSLYIISILNTYQPKNWLIFFKNWFIQNIILKHKYYLDDKINTELSSILIKDENYEEVIYKKSRKIWHNKRDILLNQHKNKIKESLWGEDQDLVNSILKNLSLISTLLPITIVTSESYEKIKYELKEIYDLTVFESAETYKTIFNKVYAKFKSNKNIIVVEDKESIPEINKYILNYDQTVKIEKYSLKGFHQQGMINLIDMNLTERLYAARNIAHLMISGNKNIRIYLLKGIVLFSAFDDILNQVLFKILESKGIKETKIIDTPFHSLVDNILEFNNKQIFLIQNNLIDYKNTSNIIWQLKALEKIKKSGIRIVNFDINLLLENPVKRIKEFVQKNIL